MRTDESIKNSGQLGFPGPDPVFGIGGEGETPIDLIHHNSLHYSKRARRDHRGGLQPPDLQGRRLVPDLGDRGEEARAARHVHDGARQPGPGQGLGPGHRAVLGALLRRARRPRGDRLVRGGHALPRRARPGGHPPGGLLGAHQGRDLVRRTSRRPTAAARSSTRSTSPAASTCSASTAATAACGAPRAALVAARPARLPGNRRRPHRPHSQDRLRLRVPAAEQRSQGRAAAGATRAARDRAAGAPLGEADVRRAGPAGGWTLPTWRTQMVACVAPRRPRSRPRPASA